LSAAPRQNWLTSVSPGWHTTALSRHYTVQLGKMLNEAAATGTDLAPYLRNVNVRWDAVDTTDVAEMHFSPDERVRYRLAEGDLLVCEGGEIGRTAIWRGELPECFFQKAVHRLRPIGRGQVPRYLYYCMRAAASEGAFAEDGNKSTIAHLTAEKLRSQRFPFPPAEQQLAVVRFLDDATGRIDDVIKHRALLRGLLDERRRAVIHEGVAGGFLPAPRRVASSLPWLDSTPHGWREARLKLVARLGSGHTPSRSHPEWWRPEDCVIPWITTGEVAQMRSDRIEEISHTRERISQIGLENSSAELHPAGTVVLCRTAASAGYSAIMKAAMATSQDFATWTCGPLLRPRFLLLCLRAMRSDLLGRLAMGSTHRTIYMPEIESIRVPLPSLREQERIVNDVHIRVGAMDRVADAIEQQVSLLEEHKRALIVAAVTGQIGVAEDAA
jgi:type I restriction enzyme S subunit